MTRRHKKMASKRVIHRQRIVAWRYKGKHHRGFNKPAIIGEGMIYFVVRGKLHRTDGPAAIVHGEEQWWFKGIMFNSEFEMRAYIAGRP